MTTAVRVKVSGEVQGVGFRFSAAREAERLGVVGWVRNEPDGSVAAHVEGDQDAVDAMLAWCRTGPPSARVGDVATDPVDPEHPASFDVQP